MTYSVVLRSIEEMMRKLFISVLTAITLTVPPLMAQELQSVRMHAGIVDIEALASGEKAFPLIEPIIITEPAFEGNVRSYAVRMPHGVDGVTVVIEALKPYEFGILDLNGVRGEFMGLRYETNHGMFTGQVIPLDLQPGENHLRIAVKDPFSTNVYELDITRPTTLSDDTTLTALHLDSGELVPAFEPERRLYSTRVVGNSLMVVPTPRIGAITVVGTGSNGAALEVNGNVISGLTAGANTVSIVVRAEDGTSGSYILTVEASDDIRAVAAGDVLSWPDVCNRDSGCDGTLNGIHGRFACIGDDKRIEFANLEADIKGFCLISKGEDGIVTGASGWFFAAFP